MVGPSSSTQFAIPIYSDTNGTQLSNSAILINGSNNLTGIGSLNGRTISDWVDGPASASSTNLAVFNGTTGKAIQDSGITALNIVTMSSPSFLIGNILTSGGLDKSAMDSGIPLSDLPTMAANATGTYQPILSGADNSKELISASYKIPLAVCPNDQILKSNGVDYICQNDIGGGDVAGPVTSRINVPALFADSSGKLIKDGEASLMDFDESGPVPAYKEARVFYDSATKALAYYSSTTNLPIEIGQQMVFLANNNSVVNIPKGSAVYVTGATGGGPNARPRIALAIATSTTTSRIIGVTAQAIATGTDGYVTNFGLIRGVDTSGFPEGAIVYLSDSVPG